MVQLTRRDGSVVKNYDYDAFGVEKNLDAADTNPFRYCGEYFDKETGTYYLRARYYAPRIGRFISGDSYWGKDNDPLSLNFYTYCSNNPIFFFDPSGEKYIEGYEIGDHTSRGKNNNGILYEEQRKIFNDWLNSTAPSFPITIPSSGESVSNLAATIIGDSMSHIASIEKQAKVFINEKGFYQQYPAGSMAIYKPYKAFNKVATGITIISTTIDVANTWSADSGNTNLQRIQKTGIQIFGVSTSIGAGVLVGVLLVPVTGGASLVVSIGATVATSMAVSYVVEAGQNELFRILYIE